MSARRGAALLLALIALLAALAPAALAAVLEVGSSGGDVTKVPFPVRMYVDYVRVYQKAGQN